MSAGRERKRVVWDEETIQEHDKERGTRTQITEPKTPFILPYHPDTSELDIPDLSLESTTKDPAFTCLHTNTSINALSKKDNPLKDEASNKARQANEKQQQKEEKKTDTSRKEKVNKESSSPCSESQK